VLYPEAEPRDPVHIPVGVFSDLERDPDQKGRHPDSKVEKDHLDRYLCLSSSRGTVTLMRFVT
jgi:hypothetical protein